MDGAASELLLLLYNTCNNYITKNEGSVVMNVPSFIDIQSVHSKYSTLPSFRVHSQCPTLHLELMRVHVHVLEAMWHCMRLSVIRDY